MLNTLPHSLQKKLGVKAATKSATPPKTTTEHVNGTVTAAKATVAGASKEPAGSNHKSSITSSKPQMKSSQLKSPSKGVSANASAPKPIKDKAVDKQSVVPHTATSKPTATSGPLASWNIGQKRQAASTSTTTSRTLKRPSPDSEPEEGEVDERPAKRVHNIACLFAAKPERKSLPDAKRVNRAALPSEALKLDGKNLLNKTRVYNVAELSEAQKLDDKSLSAIKRVKKEPSPKEQRQRERERRAKELHREQMLKRKKENEVACFGTAEATAPKKTPKGTPGPTNTSRARAIAPNTKTDAKVKKARSSAKPSSDGKRSSAEKVAIKNKSSPKDKNPSVSSRLSDETKPEQSSTLMARSSGLTSKTTASNSSTDSKAQTDGSTGSTSRNSSPPKINSPEQNAGEKSVSPVPSNSSTTKSRSPSPESDDADEGFAGATSSDIGISSAAETVKCNRRGKATQTTPMPPAASSDDNVDSDDVLPLIRKVVRDGPSVASPTGYKLPSKSSESNVGIPDFGSNSTSASGSTGSISIPAVQKADGTTGNSSKQTSKRKRSPIEASDDATAGGDAGSIDPEVYGREMKRPKTANTRP